MDHVGRTAALFVYAYQARAVTNNKKKNKKIIVIVVVINRENGMMSLCARGASGERPKRYDIKFTR